MPGTRWKNKEKKLLRRAVRTLGKSDALIVLLHPPGALPVYPAPPDRQTPGRPGAGRTLDRIAPANSTALAQGASGPDSRHGVKPIDASIALPSSSFDKLGMRVLSGLLVRRVSSS